MTTSLKACAHQTLIFNKLVIKKRIKLSAEIEVETDD